jgi:hypothetical protein
MAACGEAATLPSMRGIFGGQLEDSGAAAPERIDPSVAQALSTSALGSAPCWPSGGPKVVWFDWDDEGRVTCDGDLGSLAPLDASGTSFPAALDALASLCAALRGPHAVGLAHGDLCPDTVRVGPDGEIVLLRSVRHVAAGALLAARLRGGASPSGVAFAAPEVATGFAVTPASDVYAIGAIAHRLATGQPPLGQIDRGDGRPAPPGAFALAVHSSLAASPSWRPDIEMLEVELRQMADAARQHADVAAARGPYRDPAMAAPTPAVPARSPAEAAAFTAAATNMSTILTGLLVVGGLFVFSGAVWLVAVTWGVLGQTARLALLGVVTGGILVGAHGAERARYGRSGAALMILGVELLWADGAYLLDITDHLNDVWAWSVLAFVMATIAFLLGWARRSGAFGAFAALHLGVLAACFGEMLQSDTKTGPALYALAVAATYAVVGLAGHRARGTLLGMPFAVGACICAWIAAAAGLRLIFDDERVLFGTVWPYGVAGAAIGIGLAASAPYRSVAWVAAGGVLSVAPSAVALVQHEHLGFLALAVVTGFALVVAAFRFGPVAREPERQAATVLIGVVNAALPTTLLFLSGCTEADGLPTLLGPHGRHFAALVGVSVLLVGCGYAFGKAAAKKEVHRVVELAGLAQFFGALTIASAIRYDDWFYPACCVCAGAAVLTLGVITRRATLAVLASVALVTNLCIQYFAKLRDALPISMLVIGFGIALLIGGVLYERQVRNLLPRLREWA